MMFRELSSGLCRAGVCRVGRQSVWMCYAAVVGAAGRHDGAGPPHRRHAAGGRRHLSCALATVSTAPMATRSSVNV